MAHFARVENEIVQAVHLVDNAWLDLNDEEKSGSDYLNALYNINAQWVQTSYNAETNGFRFNFAGLGYYWDGTGFYAPQPYPSWTLDDKYQWQPPVARPVDDKFYTWSEDTLNWVEVDLGSQKS